MGLWQGTFEGIERGWLRWFDQDGQWIPTPTEMEQRKVAIASEAVAAEREKTERLMAQLRSLGVEPEL